MQQGTTGPIKIGFSNNVIRRLKHLETGNPQIQIVTVILGAGRRTEEALHRIYAPTRLRRADGRLIKDWFERTPELEALIRALPTATELLEAYMISTRSTLARNTNGKLTFVPEP